MLIIVCETKNSIKSKTEMNYFKGLFAKIRDLGLNKILREPLQIISLRQFRKNENKYVNNYGKTYLICDNENNNLDICVNLTKKHKHFTNTLIKAPTTYRFENFLQKHVKSQVYDFISSSQHKSDNEIFRFACTKFHPNIMRNDSRKKWLKLFKRLSSKNYGAFLVIKYIKEIYEEKFI